jgi:hypothetical protein
VKLMRAIKRAIGYQDNCEHEEHLSKLIDHEVRIVDADRRLTAQSSRLRVLEWEVYGRERQRPDGEDH